MDTELNKGLKNRSPAETDASMKLPAKNIDKDATRSAVAPNPRPLGPREA